MHKYTNLNIKTLESLLKTHKKRLIELLADFQASPKKILHTQETIVKIKSAIRINEDFGCLTAVN
jgi:hypothetical protein